MVMEPPSPQCVGREFVRQYYTLLNQAPLHLHRFYSHNSSFVHGGLDNGKEAEAVYGQQDIHQKIMQLNFRDCHAKIRQVDSHETLANGVVVQVSGELSNDGAPMRRFMQTFVLAPQSPKKYYVHNDIFRYQDEVFNDDQDSTTNSEDQIADLKAELAQDSPVKPIIETKMVETLPAAVLPHTNGSSSFEDGNAAAAMEVEDGMGEWKESGSAALVSPPSFQQPSVAAAPEPPAAAVWKSPEPEPEPEPAPAPEPAEEVVEAEESVGEETVAQDNAPRTWASMMKTSGGSAPAPAPQAGKPPLAPQASLGREPGLSKEGTPFSGAAGPTGPSKPGAAPYRGQRGSSQGRSGPGTGPAGGQQQREQRGYKDDESRPSNIASDAMQLFVGNLPHNCSDEDLVELFGRYGKVTDVRINQKQGRPDQANRGGRDGKGGFQVPNFGFVVFDSTQAVEKALAAKPILLYDNHRLNVEEKKMRQARPEGGFNDRDRQERANRGSQDNLRGAGHPGRGGGERGRGGRGGGRGRGDFGGPRGGGRGGLPDGGRGGYRGGGRGA